MFVQVTGEKLVEGRGSFCTQSHTDFSDRFKETMDLLALTKKIGFRASSKFWVMQKPLGLSAQL